MGFSCHDFDTSSMAMSSHVSGCDTCRDNMSQLRLTSLNHYEHMGVHAAVMHLRILVKFTKGSFLICEPSRNETTSSAIVHHDIPDPPAEFPLSTYAHLLKMCDFIFRHNLGTRKKCVSVKENELLLSVAKREVSWALENKSRYVPPLRIKSYYDW